MESLPPSSWSERQTVDADSLIESLGIKIPSESSGPARVTRETSTKNDTNSFPVITRRPKPNLNVVSLQTTSIPPKESVTYNKETQTQSSGSERECKLSYLFFMSLMLTFFFFASLMSSSLIIVCLVHQTTLLSTKKVLNFPFSVYFFVSFICQLCCY